MFRILIFSLLVFYCASCKNKPENRLLKSRTKTQTTSFHFLKVIDSCIYRQSYVAGDKEPMLMIGSLPDSINKRLILSHLLKSNSNLRPEKFIAFDSGVIKDSDDGRKAMVFLKKSLDSPWAATLKVALLKDTDEIFLREFAEISKVSIADIIPGGFKEIIFMTNYYISGGDNYEIRIIEVKPKKQ